MTSRSHSILLVAAVALTAWFAVEIEKSCAQSVGNDWITLFDGKSLKGWHANPEKIGHGTGAKWTVEPDGVLAGEQNPPGSGNGGILLTDRKFGDFELSLEMKPSWGVDSGVFLRATDKGECIQMTVDYYNGGNIGHFYGEATGAWLARAFSLQGEETDGKLVALKTIDDKKPSAVGLISSCSPGEWLEAWKINDWNHFLIRVEGGKYPKITTTLNGQQVAVFDAATAEIPQYDRDAVLKTLTDKGSIAVQVHGGGSYPEGKKCLWRNIKVRPLD